MPRAKSRSRREEHNEQDLLLRALAWLCGALLLLPVSRAQTQETRHSGSRGPQSAERHILAVLSALRQIDRDGNGYLDPNEPLLRDRAMVDRLARLARLDPRRPMSIRAIEQALRAHYLPKSSRPSAQAPRRPAGNAPPGRDPPVPGFGNVEGEKGVPGFGTDDASNVKVERSDMEKAADRIRRYDSNRNHFLDRDEIRRARWFDDPLSYDTNRDGRLSVEELARRYALRRRSEANGRPGAAARRSSPNNGGRPSAQSEAERRRQEEERRRRAEAERRRQEEERRRRYHQVDRRIWHLAATLFERYDADRNGQLDRDELRGTGIPPAPGDTSGDGRLSRGELALWLSEETGHQRNRLAGRPPDWFTARDANGDGQVTMAEFADEWTEDKLAEFDRYDANGDGVIVAQECSRPGGILRGGHVNSHFQIIPQGGTVSSEIRVDDRSTVADLDVQVSITHTRDEFLDAYLTGPGGQTVELFSGVGGEDDHFDGTIFDDEASRPIARGHAPFAGRFQPGALAKGQPGLKQFYGRSMAGTWKLTIRATRSDRVGALHGWALLAKKAEAD